MMDLATRTLAKGLRVGGAQGGGREGGSAVCHKIWNAAA